MTPYATFTYFAFLLVATLPTVLMGWLRRLNRWWIVAATLAMLVLQYSSVNILVPDAVFNELALLALYAVYEGLIAFTFLALRPRANSRPLFYAALLLALVPLAAAKFSPILAPNTVVGFLGISYVTFRALDVIIGIQDRLITTLPVVQYFVYLFFFPTISSGPVDRYRRFAADWQRDRSFTQLLDDFDGGVHRIMRGFLYKFILGALIKQYWLDPVAGGTGLLATLSYMYAYSFYLFFDFAGYSAFAIGISYFFGIHTPENFRHPFISNSIADFWNRWHISLSAWFRDHIYMRFVLAATRAKWFSHKHTASYLGYLLAFGLMGLWHGPAPNYIVYGLYHAALLVGYDAFARWNKVHNIWGDSLPWRIASVVLTFNFVCFGLLIFSGHLSLPGSLSSGAAHGTNLLMGGR